MASWTSLKRIPEFGALERVLEALSPLNPEGRRKVIEAAHSLLEIGEGRRPGARGQDRPELRPRRKRR